MEGKCFAVVTLPKDDQSNLIEINKKDFYTNWDEASEAFSTVVEHLTGFYCKVPKTPEPLSVESSSELIQLWICNTPVVDPY